MGPKTLPKPLQNRTKIDESRYQNRSKFCMHSALPFGGSGGQHKPKSLAKWSREGGRLSSWLEASWGAFGAAWGPSSNFDRFLIDF